MTPIDNGYIDCFPSQKAHRSHLKNPKIQQTFETSPYRFETRYRFYFVISKKSPLATQLDKIRIPELISLTRLNEILHRYGLPPSAE